MFLENCLGLRRGDCGGAERKGGLCPAVRRRGPEGVEGGEGVLGGVSGWSTDGTGETSRTSGRGVGSTTRGSRGEGWSPILGAAEDGGAESGLDSSVWTAGVPAALSDPGADDPSPTCWLGRPERGAGVTPGPQAGSVARDQESLARGPPY